MRKTLLILNPLNDQRDVNACLAEVAQAALPQSDGPTDIDQVIWNAIQQEIASRPEAFLFETFDWQLSQVSYSDDLSRAVVWLDPFDPVTGMTIATEPMAVIVTLSPGGSVC